MHTRRLFYVLMSMFVLCLAACEDNGPEGLSDFDSDNEETEINDFNDVENEDESKNSYAGEPEVSEHDNYVWFDLSGIQSFSFTQTDYSISSGQPWSGTTSGIETPNARGYIDAKAGRHGTEEVAQWFLSQITNGGYAGCDDAGGTPDKLNFAFSGDIEFSMSDSNYKCNDMVIGQGHFTGANNWWVGGNNSIQFSGSIFGGIAKLCIADGYRPAFVIFYTPGMCVNTFAMFVLDPFKK